MIYIKLKAGSPRNKIEHVAQIINDLVDAGALIPPNSGSGLPSQPPSQTTSGTLQNPLSADLKTSFSSMDYVLNFDASVTQAPLAGMVAGYPAYMVYYGNYSLTELKNMNVTFNDVGLYVRAENGEIQSGEIAGPLIRDVKVADVINQLNNSYGAPSGGFSDSELAGLNANVNLWLKWESATATATLYNATLDITMADQSSGGVPRMS